MPFVKRIIRALLLLLILVLLVAQFFHPKPNTSDDEGRSITTKFVVPETVQSVLKNSCYDCHSNHTNYPWYSKIQPVDWWLDYHIHEAHKELNFSEFAGYGPRRQYRKFVEIKEELEEGEMPLKSYTLIHRNAILDDQQKQLVIQWSLAMKDTMEQHYPMDSLKRKQQ